MASTIAEVLADRCARDPSGTFYIHGDAELTVAALAEQVDDAARRLVALGVAPGERVVVWLPNGALWIAVFLACARIGAVAVTAGPRLRLADLPHMLEQSRARALLYAPRFMGVDYDAMAAELVERREAGELPDLRHILRCSHDGADAGRPVNDVDGVQEWSALRAESSLPEPPPADAEAVICYTGGTTGQARGCVHDHATLVRNARVAGELTGFAPGERLVSAMPFAHVFGFHMGVLQPLLLGASLVEAEPFDAERALDLVETHGGTVVYGVPAMGSELIAAQLERPRRLQTLRVALLAGAPISPKLRRRAADVLGCYVTVVYGATESPTLTQLSPDASEGAWLESVGRATDGVELAIFEPETTRPLPTSEIGQIAARGYNHMVGYLNDPAATKAKYRDGWIIPGDFGRLDGDGYLYVAGRAEDMFLCGGFNVYPREVEGQLELLEGIDEVVVVPVPDERLGEVGLAYATVESASLSANAVLAWSRENMASYKRPRYLRILPAMPRTHVGKTARNELAKRARTDLPDLAWGAE